MEMSMTSEKSTKGKSQKQGGKKASKEVTNERETIAKFQDGLGETHILGLMRAGKRLIILDWSAHWGDRYLGSVSGRDEVDAMTTDYLGFAPDLTEPYCRPVSEFDLRARGDGESDE